MREPEALRVLLPALCHQAPMCQHPTESATVLTQPALLQPHASRSLETHLPEQGGGLSGRGECVCAFTGGLQLTPPLISHCAMIRYASHPHRSVCRSSTWGSELGSSVIYSFLGGFKQTTPLKHLYSSFYISQWGEETEVGERGRK